MDTIYILFFLILSVNNFGKTLKKIMKRTIRERPVDADAKD